MSWSVVRTRELACPPERAWDLVSDLALTPSLNPMIRSVDVDGADSGLGARRRCHAAGPGHLDEEVVAWDPPHGLTMRIVGGMPVRGEGRWTVTPTPHGSEVRFEYHPLPHLGPLGAGLHRLMRGQLRRNFDAMLDALVEHVAVGS